MFLDSVRKTVEPVARFLDDELQEVSTPDNRLIQSMRYTLLADGKKLRPWLVLTTAKLCGADLTNAVRVAASIEMIHRYSLIHDDLPCFDDDNERWGKPTNHIAFDEETAIVAGDALQSKAFEVLADERTHAEAGVRCKLISELAKNIGMSGMCGGQQIDTMMQKRKLEPTEKLMIQNQVMKTGALFKFSCQSGCILGNNDENILKFLEQYAYYLGLIFQMTDDILDKEDGEVSFLNILSEDQLRVRIKDYIEKAKNVAIELHCNELKQLVEFLEYREY